HKGGGPDFFGDGKLEVPEPAEYCGGDPEGDQIEDFFRVGDELVFEQESGEYTEQTGGNCGKSAEITFRIEKDVPFLAGEILEIEMVGEIIAGLVFAAHVVGGGEKEFLRGGPRGTVSDGRRIWRVSVGEKCRCFGVAGLFGKVSDVGLGQLNVADGNES